MGEVVSVGGGGGDAEVATVTVRWFVVVGEGG